MAKKRKRSGGGRGKPAAAGAAGSSSKPAAQAPRAVARRHGLDPWLLGLAVLGMALTAYLTATAWFGDHPAFCGADSGCDLVQSSRWSTFLGLPMSLWGLLTYAVLARALWRLRTRPSAWRFAIVVAFVGAAVSWFLTLVSFLAIEATCAYCLASFAIINAVLVLLLVRRPAHLPEHRWGKALPAPLALAGVVVLGLHLHFSGLFDAGAGPEDGYLKSLAVHLEDSGALFFGAYWCPACQDQKALFGASVERLPYVECTPEGRNGPLNIQCLDNEIKDYPTWIIDGGRHTGVVSAKELARLSRFRFDGATGSTR